MRLTPALAALLALVCAAPAAAQVQRPLPVVQRLEPTSGPPGTEVSLVGRHFDDEQTVLLGETALEVTSRMPNRWTVRIPADAPSGPIMIRTARGTVTGPRFRVSAAAPPPVIASIEPASGPPGSEVVLRGESFSPRLTENQVHLGERPVVVRSATPTELTVIVPSDATTATFRVEVTGAGRAESTATFTVSTGTSIASFEPRLGPPGTLVTLRGTGFARTASHNRVFLGELPARVRRASVTELQVEVPRRDATSGRFRVEVRGGTRAHSEGEFQVRMAPTVSAMEPESGAPGTRVTLRGTGFGADVREVRATIGQTELTVRDLAEDRLVVEIPSGAGNGPIEVTVSGLGPARTRGAFRVLEAVRVESFEPRSGGAGSIVTLRGRGFSPQLASNTVTLSGQPAEVVRATDTTLEVRVPAGVRSGPLVVAVVNAGEARTGQPFVVTRPPVLESFAPTSGAPGTVVTLRGTSFGTRPGLLDVRLGETRVEVQRATETQIDVVVPPDARTGRFRVTVRLEGSATATSDFVVTVP
jgi:hypothetical protein